MAANMAIFFNFATLLASIFVFKATLIPSNKQKKNSAEAFFTFTALTGRK